MNTNMFFTANFHLNELSKRSSCEYLLALQEDRVREVTLDIPIHHSVQLLKFINADLPTEIQELLSISSIKKLNQDFCVTHTIPAKFLVAYVDDTPRPDILSLFIRPVYELLYKEVLNTWINGSIAGKMAFAQVFGSSGIGKSQFLLYCLFRLLREPETSELPHAPIILANFQFQDDHSSRAYVFRAGQAWTDDQLREHTYCLVDASFPKNNAMERVLFTSSNHVGAFSWKDPVILLH
jgi:hypothetical protein